MEPLGEDDPRVVGAYRLLGRLGVGGMGRVFLGRSAGGRTVAVKAVHAHFAADEQFRARFRREVEAARRVGGAWTAPVLDADPEATVPWVATGYVAGPSLARAVTDFGPFGEHSVRALGAGLAEALAAVHALGLVHRDVKPSNVLLTLDGPLLIDFGIARAMDDSASLTSTGVSVGSPGYMAPEQILGKGVTGAGDVFSLGAVLAFAATGTSPFAGDGSAALLYKVVHEEPELGPAPTGELREVITACLAKTAERRPAPEEIARRLTGKETGGAAALVRAGWLPGPLVEQVSRQAVELLNLDVRTEAVRSQVVAEGAGDGTGDGTGERAGFGPPDSSSGTVSGLVPFDAPAQVPQQVAGQAPGQVRQPAPGSTPWPVAGVSAGAGVGAGADGPVGTAAPYEATASAAPGNASAPTTSDPTAAGPTTSSTSPTSSADPYGTTASADARERRFAVTGSLARGNKDRPRRMSCTLVLSVAGALAAATTAAFVLNLWPGTGGGGGAASRPPAGATLPPPTGGSGSGVSVPKSFLGTWTGEIRTRDNFPNGSITSIIKAGGKGDYVVRTTYGFVIAQCEAKAELVSASATKLVLQERTDGKPGPGCTGAQASVTYTLGKDGKLSFTSDDEAGGQPHAVLSRVGG
ncbi:serine/threonine-protein kinase [Streptomyces sp. MST-110588]|uniref:serine/threonine-protein kinase n=1 Tax=Streptomyces sp. MST-110588 TaxID=2833628 RepID=UPI001F5D24A3|nr:serine/threonine-protein kinase [Streptomyces sp. MST-110588]UNO41268.1 serine/threonine protein kinase [Streptomyces sp. MST-110588]